MSQKKSSFKINTNGKSYLLHDSPLYKLKTKKKLMKLFNINSEELKSLRSEEGNYSVFIQKSKSGKERTIEHPVKFVDKIHSQIATYLCRIAQPQFMHSGIKGKSHVTNAKAHLGDNKVLTSDIKSFFPSTTRGMVFRFFLVRMKCNPDVADALADICTYNGHIPTGSRLSMPLAFWANMDMFFELENLAKLNSVFMTVYVDDVTFSGDNLNRLFLSTAKKIIKKHGHLMHPDKTVLYAEKDVKIITGVVIKGDDIYIKNQQHANIYADIVMWKYVRDDLYVPESLKNRLLGRLNSLSVIEPRLKDKAKSVKNYKRKIV